MSHHKVSHLQSPINAPIKYRRPTPYSFRDIAQTMFLKVKVTIARSDQGHTFIYTNSQPVSLLSINILRHMLSEIQLRHDFSH